MLIYIYIKEGERILSQGKAIYNITDLKEFSCAELGFVVMFFPPLYSLFLYSKMLVTVFVKC